MFKKLIFSVLALSTSFTLFSPAIIDAQSTEITSETILNFNSDIVVNKDNSIDVTETIVYDSGGAEKHGIYRDIRTSSSQKRKMNIGNVSVVDQMGDSYIFETNKSNNSFRIKIGDPNTTFQGQKIYIIRYHATKAVGQFDEFDEIYWNVTGNDWEMPIYQASASIILPDSIKATQTACYFGPYGSKDTCEQINRIDATSTFMFIGSSILDPGEGLTVAAGFQKGIVTPYTAANDAQDFFAKYWTWMLGALLPLLSLILSLRIWYMKGRDDRETRTIVPEYDVPDNLTPMETVGIVKERIYSNHISAEIIYLATKGYLKINQLETKKLGLFTSTDYELIKLKEFTGLQNDFDMDLLEKLFAKEQSVKLSSLKEKFYMHTATIVKAASTGLITKGYYKSIGRMKDGPGRGIFILIIAIWTAIFVGGIVGVFIMDGQPLPLVIGIFLSIIIWGIVSYFNPAKTEKGVTAKEHILGLEEYLRIAEKDRLHFHNAPEKKPEVFEKLLPYAMVLGVATIWAKEFKDIYTEPPNWYSSPSNQAFNALVLSNSLSDFSTAATSSLVTAPGSGSSGGGFSGGGGGGGGGGSW